MPAIDLTLLHQYLTEQQPMMVTELKHYVEIESGSRDKAGVDRVGADVSKAFEALQFTVERIPEEQAGDHLVARRSGGGQGRLLALIHLDTVWPRGILAENPFRIEGDRAYGPGVLDMKGGWVVLLGALRALRQAGWDGLASTTVFMTGDEELGSVAGRPWIEREAREADWALVMEPARENGNLVMRRGMVGAVGFEVEGVSAHTMLRDRGASAIIELAHKALAIEALNDPERGMLTNVGIVEGGSARQVVADRARASIDLRAPSAELAEELIAKVRAIAEMQHVPGTRTTMAGGITRPAFDETPASRRMLELAQACGSTLGMSSLDGAFTRAGSDGNFTAALGVPTLDGLGPEGANGCSRDEYTILSSLPRRAALLAGIIAGLPDTA